MHARFLQTATLTIEAFLRDACHFRPIRHMLKFTPDFPDSNQHFAVVFVRLSPPVVLVCGGPG